MWRALNNKGKVIHKWSRILPGDRLNEPEGFICYTTFMWRLSVYGRLFAEAIRENIGTTEDDQVPMQGGAQLIESNQDDGDSVENTTTAHHSDGQTSCTLPQISSEDIQEDSFEQIQVMRSNGNTTLVLGKRNGELVVRKYFNEIENWRNECAIYKMIDGIGIAPKLLGQAEFITPDEHIIPAIEVEYLRPTLFESDDIHEIRSYMRSLLEALSVIHERGILHLDLNADNIIAFKNNEGEWKVKLIDFERSCYKEQSIDVSICCGTPGYASPECIDCAWVETRTNKQRIRQNEGKPDVYSAGIMLVELLLGIDLHHFQVSSDRIVACIGRVMSTEDGESACLSHAQVCAQLAKTLRACVHLSPRFEQDLSDSPITHPSGAMALDLVYKMTRSPIEKRLTAREALAHPFFADLNDARRQS